MNKYIQEPTDNYDFTQVFLKTPYSISGGGFFIKFEINKQPFYIKTPKCSTKNGFIKTGKKHYCDLLFSIVDNQDFLKWMENLICYSQQHILEQNEKWFQETLDKNDIEDITILPFKLYKGGNSFLIRCNIDTDNNIKVYDENTNEISLTDINENVNIITLLELRGIKYSLKSFQFEFIIKQIMVIKNINILENYLLTPPQKSHEESFSSTITQNTNNKLEEIKDNNLGEIENQDLEENKDNNLEEIENQDLEEIKDNNLGEIENLKIENNILGEIKDNNLEENKDNNLGEIENLEIENNNLGENENQELEKNKDNNLGEIENQELEENEMESMPNELEEIVDLKMYLEENENKEDVIILKKPNELYYNMYNEAKQKAKEARLNAISSYLDAKNIKMLYNLDDSDEDENEDEDDFMDFSINSENDKSIEDDDEDNDKY